LDAPLGAGRSVGAPAATNEANAPAVGAPAATNEANPSARSPGRLLTTLVAAVLALIFWAGIAGALGMSLHRVGPAPLPGKVRDAEKSPGVSRARDAGREEGPVIWWYRPGRGRSDGACPESPASFPPGVTPIATTPDSPDRIKQPGCARRRVA